MAAEQNYKSPPVSENSDSHPKGHSRIGTTWIALGVFTLVLLLLLVFIIQNNVSVKIHYLGASGSIGFGVAMLLAAVIGAILTLLIGSIRILQLKFSNNRHSDRN